MKRSRHMRHATLPAAAVAVAALFISGRATQNTSLPNQFPFPNSSGQSATFSQNGSLDLTNAFFQDLGTNGRTCGSCHQPDQGWTVAADLVKARFDATNGLDPIFRTNDGSNCTHNIDTSTLSGRTSAYTPPTGGGLIRIGID